MKQLNQVVQINLKQLLIKEMINGFMVKLKNVKIEVRKTEARLNRISKQLLAIKRRQDRMGTSVYNRARIKELERLKDQTFETFKRQRDERQALGAAICRLRECYHERSSMKVSDLLNKYLTESAGEIELKASRAIT